MNTHATNLTVRILLLLLTTASASYASYAIVRGGSARAYAALARYRGWLDGQLRLLFLPERSSTIVLTQLALAVLLCASAIWWLSLLPVLGLLLVAYTPQLVLTSMRNRRRQQIDARLDNFALTLSNAMRATPSIGRALALVQKVLPAPLDKEIELMLRELRVGSSVEQSLLAMSARVKSVSLDAVLSGILIGRQVGGNLPEILETTSSTLREMGRLEGVLRSKTAEAKAQVYVLALFPLILGLCFNTVSPGYFVSMSNSPLGLVLLAAALGFWVASILVARRILSVEL